MRRNCQDEDYQSQGIDLALSMYDILYKFVLDEANILLWIEEDSQEASKEEDCSLQRVRRLILMLRCGGLRPNRYAAVDSVFGECISRICLCSKN